MRFADSHLHLDGRTASQAVPLAVETGTLLLTCGVNRESSERGLDLQAAHPDVVKAFVGVHPSEAEKAGDTKWLKEALSVAKGLGEVGLDPKYSPVASGGAQARVFLSQLEAAEAMRRPVQVHSRGAERECLDALKSHRLGGVLMHWFQDGERLREVTEEGYFVSFGPSLIYSKRLQRLASRCDRTLTLTETDSPVPFGPLGGSNGPSLIPSVVFKLAELWRTPFEDARAAVAENAARYLRESEKG